jgi:hypothetical protein
MDTASSADYFFNSLAANSKNIQRLAVDDQAYFFPDGYPYIAVMQYRNVFILLRHRAPKDVTGKVFADIDETKQQITQLFQELQDFLTKGESK